MTANYKDKVPKIRSVTGPGRRPRLPDARPNHATTKDMEYTDEELEFFRAVLKFKADKHEPFPSLRDLLRIVHSLGYRKSPPCN